MKRKNIFKGILISIASLIVGFFAIAFPFNFFENLSSNQMTVLFATEIIVYTGVGMIFLVAKQIEEDKKEKAIQKQRKQRIEIKQFQDDWFDLVA